LQELSSERAARLAAEKDAESVHRSCEARIASLKSELDQTSSAPRSDGSDDEEAAAAGQPPALAGPGYKWVLVKEGSDPQAAAGSQSGALGSAPQDDDGEYPRWGLGQEAGSRSRHGDARSKESLQELERLRSLLHSREGEIGSLKEQIQGLEATRDSLAEELVQSFQRRDADEELLEDFEELRKQHKSLQVRHASAVELLGEREERLEELTADLEDVKALYRDQIEYMVEQVIALTPKNTPSLTPATSFGSAHAAMQASLRHGSDGGSGHADAPPPVDVPGARTSSG